jgi:hypothetical protein
VVHSVIALSEASISATADLAAWAAIAAEGSTAEASVEEAASVGAVVFAEVAVVEVAVVEVGSEEAAEDAESMECQFETIRARFMP